VNEVAGFALIVFGVLSFVSLFLAGDALAGMAWADMLQTVFGDGALLAAAALLAMGIGLWLPKAGIRFQVSPGRLLALELAFLTLLALLHLVQSDSEMRALARAGEGGGLVGWVLSFPVMSILGQSGAVLLFSIAFGISLVFGLGLRQGHVAALFARFGLQLQRASQATEEDTQEELRQRYRELAEGGGYRMPLMRIRREPGPMSAPPQVQAQPAPPDSAPAAPAAPPTPVKAMPVAAPVARAVAAVPSAIVKPTSPPSWRETLPSIDCLTTAVMLLPDDGETSRIGQIVRNTLRDLGLPVAIRQVQVGPCVTRFVLQPQAVDGNEPARLRKQVPALSQALKVERLRLEAPIPGTQQLAIELPNRRPALVALRNSLESHSYQSRRTSSSTALLLPLGRDLSLRTQSVDLAQLPHLLVAGVEGAGKSMCLAAIATSLLMQYDSQHVQFVILVPSLGRLSRFSGIPHLVGPIETQPDRIAGVLAWCLEEMQRRYQLLEARGAGNIAQYHAESQRARHSPAAERLPYLLIFIDEVASLMAGKVAGTERAITRLAQMAHGVGIHLVMASQAPSADEITGLVKSYFPARIAFALASAADSRMVIDREGAEGLQGRGDMLFLSSDAPGLPRLQGCFVSEDDTRQVVAHWRREHDQRVAAGVITPKREAPWETGIQRRQLLDDTDPKLESVLGLGVELGELSTAIIQRRLGLSYPRAGRIIEMLHSLGVLGAENAHSNSRRVKIPPGTDPMAYAQSMYNKRRTAH